MASVTPIPAICIPDCPTADRGSPGISIAEGGKGKVRFAGVRAGKMEYKL